MFPNCLTLIYHARPLPPKRKEGTDHAGEYDDCGSGDAAGGRGRAGRNVHLRLQARRGLRATAWGWRYVTTAVTADGLRVSNPTGAWIPAYNSISLDLAGLVKSPVPSTPNQLFGDFTATLTYSGFTNWGDSPYDGQRNEFRMQAPWGSLGGEEYMIGRRYSYNWVVEGGYAPNNATFAGRTTGGEWLTIRLDRSRLGGRLHHPASQ